MSRVQNMDTERNDSINIDSEQALETIFGQYYHSLCFYASRFLSDSELIKDTVQDVFVACWNKHLDFPNHYALRAYLYSSVYHSCLDVIKLRKIRSGHHDKIRSANSGEEPDFLVSRIETEALEELFMAIESLPGQCRAVFRLGYIEGRSVEETAAELNISPNTVKTQRARAKKLLKERLRNLYSLLLAMYVI